MESRLEKLIVYVGIVYCAAVIILGLTGRL